MVNRCIIKVIKEEKRKEINMSHKTCRWKYLRLVLDLITGWFCWFWIWLQVEFCWFWYWSQTGSVGSGCVYRLVLLVTVCWYIRSGSDWMYSWNTQNSPCLCNNLCRCSASQGHRWGHTPARITEPADWSWAAAPEAANTLFTWS